jgi:outer membrane protein assembly factor BamD (BamD/ComL family)
MNLPQPVRTRRFRLDERQIASVVGAWCLASIASVAIAQDTYTLGEDDRWSAPDEIDPGSPAGQLARARRALAQGDYPLAEELASAWIERHQRNGLLPEAHLVRGDALLAMKEHYKALFDYEAIARGYPASEAFIIALERELEIARLFGRGMKRKLWGVRWADASDEAEELFIRIQERLPGSRLAEDAGMELADFYFRRRNMTLAAEAYDLFIENYPQSPQISRARKRSIYAHLAAFKAPEFDAAGLYEARAKLRELQIVEPAVAQQVGADALLFSIDEVDARKMLVTAQWYERTGDIVAAEFTIRRLLRRYPRSVAARDALELLPGLIDRLPPAVRAELPDYESLRHGVIDAATAEPQASSTRPSSDAIEAPGP